VQKLHDGVTDGQVKMPAYTIGFTFVQTLTIKLVELLFHLWVCDSGYATRDKTVKSTAPDSDSSESDQTEQLSDCVRTLLNAVSITLLGLQECNPNCLAVNLFCLYYIQLLKNLIAL